MSSDSPRFIIHVDMDAFYASVEQRDFPEYAGRPVIVGGLGGRGVVAAASYEARQFGIHSAMPMVRARALCSDAVYVTPRMQRYREVSGQIFRVFNETTPLVEGLSLDEAFLDVTGATRLFGEGVEIAQRIRTDVRRELELGCSVGVAPNKFLAKLASVEAKPVATPERVLPGPGVVEVLPDRVLEFLHPLPVSKLWGVGPKTLEKLERLGVATVGDLAGFDQRSIINSLGQASGTHLLALSNGLDDRSVETGREMKSISHEETYPHDVHEMAVLERELVRLADAVSGRLRRHGTAARTLSIKVRFAGFHTVSRSVTPGSAIDTGPELVAELKPLLQALDVSVGVRLLGVAASNFAERQQQLSLLDAGAGGADSIRSAAAIDEIRERFGAAAIGPASSITKEGLRIVRKGAQQWGPDQERIDETGGAR